MPSPYEVVLGDAFDDLHPRLRAYFGEIPPGSVGRGRGTFDRVGTPMRWLWPVLAVLARQGIAFAVWEQQVPFEVENHSTEGDAHAAPHHPTVSAIRTFHFRKSQRQMIDAITLEKAPDGGLVLVDHLGPRRYLSAQLHMTVRDGALDMRSTKTTRMTVRVGRRHIRIPALIAPTVTLTERFDNATERQHVSVVLAVPGLGRIYEYAGFFEYAITAESHGGTFG
ncbi:MAG: DUF4166 domain-containing protein [Lacisediminihabitans sp.]